MISGFHHDVNEICNLLEFYIQQSGNSVLNSRDNLPVPEHQYGIIAVCCMRSQKSADLKNISYITLGLNMGQVKMNNKRLNVQICDGTDNTVHTARTRAQQPELHH